MLSKDVGARENGAKVQITWKYYFAHLNYEKDVYELEGHVGEEVFNLDLLPKLGS